MGFQKKTVLENVSQTVRLKTRTREGYLATVIFPNRRKVRSGNGSLRLWLLNRFSVFKIGCKLWLLNRFFLQNRFSALKTGCIPVSGFQNRFRIGFKFFKPC